MTVLSGLALVVALAAPAAVQSAGAPTLGLGCAGGASLATTDTAYTSPNNTYATVKELAVKLGVDDSSRLRKAALKP